MGQKRYTIDEYLLLKPKIRRYASFNMNVNNNLSHGMEGKRYVFAWFKPTCRHSVIRHEHKISFRQFHFNIFEIVVTYYVYKYFISLCFIDIRVCHCSDLVDLSLNFCDILMECQLYRCIFLHETKRRKFSPVQLKNMLICLNSDMIFFS